MPHGDSANQKMLLQFDFLDDSGCVVFKRRLNSGGHLMTKNLRETNQLHTTSSMAASTPISQADIDRAINAAIEELWYVSMNDKPHAA